MTQKLEETYLGEIAEIYSGIPIHRYTEKNLKKQKILQQKSVTDKTKKIDYAIEEVSTDINKRYYSKENDIIFKLQGQPLAKRINQDYEKIIITHNFAIIRLKENYDPKFIENLLNDPTVLNQIIRISQGSRIIRTSITTLNRLKIIVPPYEKQKEYSQLFEQLNKRIRLKEQSIKNDEEIKESLINDLLGDIYES